MSRRATSADRRDWLNPVLIREIRAVVRFRRRLQGGRLVKWLVVGIPVLAYLLILASLLLALDEAGSRGGEAMVMLIGSLVLTVVCLVAPGAAAPSLVIERQKGTWDLLALTLLTPREIIMGKLWGRLAALFIALGLVLPLLLFCLDPDDDTVCLLVGLAVVVPATTLGFGAFGLLCSAKARTPAAAAATSYTVAVAMVVVIPLLEVIVADLTDRSDPVLLFVTCPYAAWAGIASHLSGGAPETAWVAWLMPPLFIAWGAGCCRLLLANFDPWLRVEPETKHDAGTARPDQAIPQHDGGGPPQPDALGG